MADLSNIIINVERAITELRLGQPITIFENGDGLLIQAIEGMQEHSLDKLKQLNDDLFVVLTKQRAQTLYPNAEILRTIKISLGELELSAIMSLSAIKIKDESYVLPYVYAGNNSSIALQLIKYAQLIPALVVSRIENNSLAESQNIYSLTFSAIGEYEQAVAQSLTPICTAPLTLRNALDASAVIFRAQPGLREHYAIIIGTPDEKIPIVRVHSSCFTGDLLGSLKCDCGEQLQESMSYMSENGGGIILYMIQEGRGIGLANKMRAYALQEEGMDTIQANEFLGFEDDERPYLPAAHMLKKLGYNKIKLMTNNPRKIKGIEEHGIEVVDRVGLIITPHEHNDDYLSTKFSKLGHMSE